MQEIALRAALVRCCAGPCHARDACGAHGYRQGLWQRKSSGFSFAWVPQGFALVCAVKQDCLFCFTPSPEQHRLPPWSWCPSPGHDGGQCDVGQHILLLFFRLLVSCQAMYLSTARVEDIGSDELQVSVYCACSSVRLANGCRLFIINRIRRRRSAWKRQPRHHQVAERRRWFWVGVVTGTRKTHIITFLWTCFDVLSHPRGFRDAFAIARAGCSARREWLLSPEGTARKASHRAPRRLPSHRRAVGWRRRVSIIAGPMAVGFSLLHSRHLRSCAAAACWRSAWGSQALTTHAINSLLHMCFAFFCHEGCFFLRFTFS